MRQNNFITSLLASLNKNRSKAQLRADIKSLGDSSDTQFSNLDIANTRAEINKQIKSISKK